MLKLSIPKKYEAEVNFVLNNIFTHHCKCKYTCELNSSDYIKITFNNKYIILDITFFKNIYKKGNINLVKSSFANLHFNNINISKDNIIYKRFPVIFGNPSIERIGDAVKINFDLIGTIFLFLSRYEDLYNDNKDSHSRILCKNSIFPNEIYTRPIVDEYIYLLFQLIQCHLGCELFEIKYQNLLSFDIDIPWDATCDSFSSFSKAALGDVIKRNDLNNLFKRCGRYLFSKFSNYKYDNLYTFDFISNLLNDNKLTATFFVIPDSRMPNNGTYDIECSRFKSLLSDLIRGNHRLGHHCTYQAYNNSKLLCMQFNHLKKYLSQHYSINDIVDNRNHFLKWDTINSPSILSSVGIDYDYTGGFPDFVGFKHGSSKQFFMWCWKTNSQCMLIQKPLILMDWSLISSDYMSLQDFVSIKEHIDKIFNQCKLYNGSFSVLWHNSTLQTDLQIRTFLYLVSLL
jgi:hypothetical protein